MKKYKDFINEDILDIMPIEIERRLRRLFHNKAYATAVADYAREWEKDAKGHDKRDLAAKIARKYKGVDTRTLIDRIDQLVKDNKIPKKLATEEYYGKRI